MKIIRMPIMSGQLCEATTAIQDSSPILKIEALSLEATTEIASSQKPSPIPNSTIKPNHPGKRHHIRRSVQENKPSIQIDDPKPKPSSKPWIPLEISHMILGHTITPFQPIDPENRGQITTKNGTTTPTRRLGYILDPYASTEFRAQRDQFQSEMNTLRNLGVQMTGEEIEKWLGVIEREWRGLWEENMSELIERDEQWWRDFFGRGYRAPATALFQRDFTIHDVYAHAHNYMDTHWAEFIRVTNWKPGNREAGREECRQRALSDIIQSLRNDRAFAALEGYGSGVGEALRVPGVQREFNARYMRLVEIEDAERLERESVGGLGLGWTSGLQRAVPWEDDV
ncbi:hypothetical protein BLS_002092 [Venturia inaequalis]|uniref:Uncharacterized protein n=1 Tax=Venturia inaequalis TaxID=5025 RepID=A0A8H3V7A1_VENIN|nr:hypothetical protein BLS_002092 [Venturia inaequalis]KAE9983360.1 hypothetical protein EG328_009997 [Venturia inaequalis]RDI83489.1 hypothetical protein Vi05172_g6443 [Venturia inaequalis]